MKTIKTKIEKDLDFEVECLQAAIYDMEINGETFSRDYSILRKKLKVVKKASKKLAKLSAKRQKLLNKRFTTFRQLDIMDM